MAKELRTAEQLADIIVAALGIGEITLLFAKTMLTGGSRRWFRLPAISLAIKGVLNKSQNDCGLNSTCGSDGRPGRP